MLTIKVIKNNKVIQQYSTDKSIANIWYAYRKQYNNIGLIKEDCFNYTLYIN